MSRAESSQSSSTDRFSSTPVTTMRSDDDTVKTESQFNTSSLPAFAEGSNPDFVLVWNEVSKVAVSQEGYNRRSVFEFNLEEEGLVLEWDNCEEEPTLHVVKIWAPLEVLKRYSEILKVRLPMKQLEDTVDCHPSTYSSTSSLLKKKSSTISNIRNCWASLKQTLRLEVDPNVFPEKCRRLTGVYSRDKEYLFDLEESNMHEIFPTSTRSRIVHFILKRKPYKSETELERDNFAFGYERLIQKGIYEAGYPLHDGSLNAKGSTRKLLNDHWGKMKHCFKFQPLDTLKDYFGVNIALYFAWLGYYTGMLGFAAIFGVVTFIYGVASISSDQYVRDVCNKSSPIVMCPVCDTVCPYWNISQRCLYSKFAHMFENDFTILFAFMMSVWTAFFLEYWKRYSARITYRWDLTSFDQRDFTPRPEYVAELKKIYPKGMDTPPNMASGEEGQAKYDFELSIPFWKKTLPYRLLSYSTISLLVVLALSALSGVIMYRVWFNFWLSKSRARQGNDLDMAMQRVIVSFTGACLNLTFIVIFGRFYERIAITLTEMEFPRTQAEFDASYTLKVYLLQFINNYSSIFYVAFFKGAYAGHPHKYHKLFGVLRQEDCGISCMPELCIQLVVILVGKQGKSMYMEVFYPWFKRGVKRIYARLKVAIVHEDTNAVTRKSKKSHHQWVNDYDLLEFGQYLLTEEYLEMVLQFGFITIFVTAFPLAPVFALINNILELRIDASKMLRHYRRPIGIRVKDIGVWASIVDGIVKVAILSNACIIALTSNFIPKLMYRYVLQDRNSPTYGTLKGYLNDTLTAYHVDDLEAKPVFVAAVSPPVCHFKTYRYDYTSEHKYQYRTEFWQIWLARAIFIILYENVVAVLILLLRWLIPDIPRSLLKQMQREQRMINELILQHESQRAHRVLSARRSRSLNTFIRRKNIQETTHNKIDEGGATTNSAHNRNEIAK